MIQETNRAAADRRFDRLGRLVGDDCLALLARAHVMVVGVGGVGSWAAEALARSGIGSITMVDFDHVCITNFNRQVMATEGMVGSPKAEMMAARLRSINPQASITVMPLFYSAETAAEVFAAKPDLVIDAIDSVGSKCHLLHQCVARGIPVVSSCGSGGRRDPTRIEIGDLSETKHDALAQAVRKLLRKTYAFPAAGKGPFGIRSVFSTEPMTMPVPLAYDEGKGIRCVCTEKSDVFTCEDRTVIMGTSCAVTGAFGFACAAEALRLLLNCERSAR